MSNLNPNPGTVSLEEVQKLIAQFENRDPRTLPQLPGRIILSDDSALAKSYRGEVYYQLRKTSNGWRCGCKAGQYGKMCKHVKGLESYLAREGRASQLLREEPTETAAQAYQRKKREAIAKARANPQTVDSLMDKAGFAPCLAGE